MSGTRLRGRIVFITGGGRGLGRAMAEALLAEGGNVAISASRSTANLGEFDEYARARFGAGRALTLHADVTDPHECDDAVARTVETFGAVHVLVNNAGRGMREISETFNVVPTRFWETDTDAWMSIIDTNVNGAFHMAKAVVPIMLAQSFGRLINVSTSLTTMVRQGYSPYGPSKAALEAMTGVWSRDLAGTGVTVNTLLPGGAADTELLPGVAGQRRGADGKMLAPAIMGPPLVWLASAASSHMTGERVIADKWVEPAPIGLVC